MRKYFLLVLLFFLALSVPPFSIATAQQDITILVNGQVITTDTLPVIENDCVLVPIRAISEAMNCDVIWYAESRTVYINNNRLASMKLVIDSDIMEKNAFNVAGFQDVVLEAPARIVNSRTLIPLRAVAEGFNAKVDWRPDTRTVTVESEFDTVRNFSDNLLEVEKNGKSGFVDLERELILPIIYDRIGISGEGRTVVQVGNKWGFVDSATGEPVVSPIYDGVNWFINGLAAVSINQKWGFIDVGGTVVVPLEYDWVRYNFENGLTSVCIGDKWGCIDTVGNVVIEILYDNQIGEFYEGFERVLKDGKYGCVDKTGAIVVPIIYDEMPTTPVNGVLRVQKDGVWGYVDCKIGIEITTLQYEYVWYYQEGIALVLKEGKYGFIDMTGAEIVVPQYDDVKWFTGDPSYKMWSLAYGMVCVLKGGNWGVMDTTGTEVVVLQYDDISSYSNALAAVCRDDKWGYINLNGEVVIALQYDVAGDFYEADWTSGKDSQQVVADVQKDGEYFTIDQSGKRLQEG